MAKTKQYYVYLLSNRSKTLYVGVTDDLERRAFQHKQKLAGHFSAKYNIMQLVYFETTDDVRAAIAREKQIKGWRRSKKIDLIQSMNPEWRDLSANWFGWQPAPPAPGSTERDSSTSSE